MYKIITALSFLALVSCNDLANKVDSQKQANSESHSINSTENKPTLSTELVSNSNTAQKNANKKIGPQFSFESELHDFGQLVDGEKMRDTLIDMHNYAAMAIMLMDEKNNNGKTDDMDDEVVLEDNVDNYSPNNGYKLLDKWEIQGDSKKKYIRECYWSFESKTHIQTCTCPSFMYGDKKTCKHIQKPENYNITSVLFHATK